MSAAKNESSTEGAPSTVGLEDSLPSGIENWNRAMRGTYMKGRKARLAGLTIGTNPYDDKRKWDGRLTWSRSFSICWRDGWKDMDSLLSSNVEVRGEAPQALSPAREAGEPRL